jgi:OTU-like cysteine protease
MSGGRCRYDSDDRNPTENSLTKSKKGTNVLTVNGQVNLLLTSVENELTIYSSREDALSNHSGSVSILKGYLIELRDANPVSCMMECMLVLKKNGLELVEQEVDGYCMLLCAVSLRVYRHDDHRTEVREHCLDFIARNEVHFNDFVAADSDEQSAKYSFTVYVSRLMRNGVHGNLTTAMQAISDLFNCPVDVYASYSLERGGDGATFKFMFIPINIFQSDYKSFDFPLLISYQDGNHYNAILNPFVSTAALGHALPGLKPGVAEKVQVAATVTASDQSTDQMKVDGVLTESTVEYQQKLAKDEHYDLQSVMNESVDMVSKLTRSFVFG